MQPPCPFHFTEFVPATSTSPFGAPRGPLPSVVRAVHGQVPRTPEIRPNRWFAANPASG